jgi:peptidoglycan/xylan/chitin deacetylase (PgdA/CDA1 family)
MKGWVCLMYHDVTPEPVRPGGGGDYFSVTREGFERQLDQLADSGYSVCSLEEVVAKSGDGVKRIACTFDDGDIGQFTRGFPALAQRGMSATFFITTDWVGQAKFVSWDGLLEMKAAGMSLQSHTRSHPFLSELNAEQLRAELEGSRGELNSRLSQETTSVAFPGGDPPQPELRDTIRDAGYSIVATSRWGVNAARLPRHANEPVWIKRCTVRGAMPDALYQRVIDGDRWLSARKELREAALRGLRASLGPTRYARIRRGFLDAARGKKSSTNNA